MASYTIAQCADNDTTLRRIYASIKSAYPHFTYDDLDIIFEIALENKTLFPGINLGGQNTSTNYLSRWVTDYRNARISPSCFRKASPKSTCSDPAIRKLVLITQGISEEQAINLEKYHNLFMSAENIQGNLLEQYIATSIRPYGWIWCAGNTLRAIDFCSSDGTILLQVKNKSNTENSSSSNIREGTSIQKWYRLGTRSSRGIKLPIYKWDSLNAIINTHKTAGFHLTPCNMNEDHYIHFISNIARYNPDIITAD